MRARLIPVAALILALPGCAVLTIDVDVYKGALANHEDVQTEQVAAMAMGAKPLLAELRYQLEQGACSTCEGAEEARSKSDFIPQVKLKSPDARRVNEILSLYQDTTSQFLRPLSEAAQRLIERFEKGRPVVERYIGGRDSAKTDKEQRAEMLAARTIEARFRLKPPKQFYRVPEPGTSQIAAVKSVWEAAEEAWQEAIRVLSSTDIRAQLKELPGDLIWDVAWIAAELTSGEGLRTLLSEPNRPEPFKTGPVMNLGELAPVLIPKDPKEALKRPLTDAAENAVEAVLAEMLADEKTGPKLATQLALAHGYAFAQSDAETDATKKSFIVIYPHKKYLTDPEIIFLTDLRALIDSQPRLAISLGAGRPNNGLEKLIDEYLRAKGLGNEFERRRGSDDKRKKLFDALINFAEKVTIIANFDPLLRDRHEDTHKYVRVLQAVGNSILSQVDALRQSEAHRGQLTRARETEVEGIRNAEARARAVLKEITAELAAKPDSFPDKQAILDALKPGQQALDTIVSQIGETVKRQRGELAAERATAATWAMAESVIARKDIQDAVEQYGKTTAPRSTAEVVGEIIRMLGIWEGGARLRGGAGDEEARRLQTAAGALSDLNLSSDSANPGAAKEKYLGIVREAGRKLAAARAAKNEDDVTKWETTRVVLARKEVQATVEQYGKTTAPRTAANVVGEIIRVLREREGRARRPGGAGDEEARRLQTVARALNDLDLARESANPGAAKEKYLGIVVEVGRKLADARTAESARAAPVAVLERWHRQLTVMNNQANPQLVIPKRIEKDGKVSEDGQKPTAKDVTDVMLATLRYEHINAMREHGPDNQITRNLAAAVELNFAYRSGMVHIRPASTFLRNSYPATILQQDPTAGFWRNMLTDHAWHQLPFFEYFYGKKHAEEIEINKTIDKQFWQSVNQVRVSGVGRTNYAIAKDDVGNWYVKSYSSNPTDIIQSAKNLAMFSAGSAMGANFLAKGGQPEGKSAVSEGTTQAPTTKEARSTLAKQFDRSTQRYEEQTLTARKNLKEEIEGLNGKLSRAVSDRLGGDAKRVEDAKVFITPLSGKAIEDLGQDKGTDGKTKPVSRLNAEIVAALRAVKRYRNDVHARITTKTVAQGQTPAADQFSTETGTQAKQAVDATVREFLDHATKERQNATAQYESGLLLIGESAGL